MTKVKICGIRTLEDALVASEAGADFIGLVFVPGRPRRLAIDEARVIVDGLRASGDHVPQVVGLFADQPLDVVSDTIRACRLDRAQLCGNESLDYCRQTEAGVIKVLHVPGGKPEEPVIADLADRISAYRGAGHLVTLDRLVAGIPGGTGERFDWAIAEELSRRGHSFLLAGGLLPENVAQAVAMVKPWGVDVSSGVETDGGKDPDKIRDFVRSARQPPGVESRHSGPESKLTAEHPGPIEAEG